MGSRTGRQWVVIAGSRCLPRCAPGGSITDAGKERYGVLYELTHGGELGKTFTPVFAL